MSHTPGPWNCEIPDIGDQQSEDERGNKYWEVTPIPQRFENNEYLCITGWMSEANARLIAAAPELLDALYKCVRLLKFLEPEVRGGYSPDGALKCGLAAIDKATAK